MLPRNRAKSARHLDADQPLGGGHFDIPRIIGRPFDLRLDRSIFADTLLEILNAHAKYSTVDEATPWLLGKYKTNEQ